MAQPITTPMLIPRDILSEEEQKVYDQFKDSKADLEKRFTWWSMHDLMKYYHSGLLTKENDANMFSFSIDLTKSELDSNQLRNPQLISGLNTAMTNLNKITTEISTVFNDAQAENARKLNEMVLSATARKGGKKKMRGGEPTVNIAEKFSAEILKTECLNDLKKDTFTTRDRIFIVDGSMPLVTEALKNQVAAPVEAPEAGPAGPAGPAAGLAAAGPAAVVTTGGRHRTRKGRKLGKKTKTQRRYKHWASRR